MEDITNDNKTRQVVKLGYARKRDVDSPERGILCHTTNNERFNQILNRCKHPRKVYLLLSSLVEPSVQQADDVAEKRKVIIGDLLSGLDIPHGDK